MNIIKFWDKDGKILRVRVNQSNKNINQAVFSKHRIPTPTDACKVAEQSGFTRVRPKK
jgi:hypothetical protein